MQQHKVKIIISGGGTGGHVFPAIAIANALKKLLGNSLDILFVGSIGRMEMEKVPQAGYTIEGLWISGLQRKLTLSNLSFPIKLISSLLKAKKIINGFNPDVVVGVGGYASGPILKVAQQKNIPTLIQEQNSYPGITNKLLAAKVSKICVAYSGLEKFFPSNKIIFTGNPVRQDITALEAKRDEALQFFKLNKTKKTILIIGGSLGARTVNESVATIINSMIANNIQLIWQTGKGYITEAKTKCEGLSDNGIYAFDFITRMDFAYAAADIVISRAGAISVSELCLAKKACILIPSPNVSEDHQTKNAMALVKNDAAILVKDIEAREILETTIMNLFNNTNLQHKLSENIGKLGKADAADNIANEILKLVKPNFELPITNYA